MPDIKPLFQSHHAIEQQVYTNDPLLEVLADSGRLNKDAATNLINVPSDKTLAQALGVSPHSGGPIGSYKAGTLQTLRELALTKEGIAALKGDEAALDRMALTVQRLSDTAQVALINGDLHTNTGLTQTREQARAITNAFYADPISSKPTSYASKNAAQLDAHGLASTNDRQWAVVTHSEGRIVSTLQHFHGSGQPLTRGGNIDLQRYGLSSAISDAYHGGRLTLSSGGVAVVENTLGEEAARSLRVPRGERGEASMQLLMGEASARTLIRAGGLLATGADAITTARSVSELMEQGNLTAAQSEANRAIARNAGGWLGGASTALALGSSSGFVPAALVVGDALLLSKAFEKAVDLKDNRDIYTHTDRTGATYEFVKGGYWERQALLDYTDDARINPVKTGVVASYEKSLELGAMATAKAAELALRKPPSPSNPFDLPAQPSDQVGLDNVNWQRDPQREAWSRLVKTNVSGVNDTGHYGEEIASPEQTHRLNQQALDQIESNILNGREAVAQHAFESLTAQHAQHYGVAIPEAITSNLPKPDEIRGSDNQLYQRNAAGAWVGKDGLATGNMAVELELTHQIRQPSLGQAQDRLAAIDLRPMPNSRDMDHGQLLYAYSVRHVNLHAQPDNLQAVELAVQRTRVSNGISGETIQQLQPNEHGQYAYDSPILHFKTGDDGVTRQIAITSSEELRQAKSDLKPEAITHTTTLNTIHVTASHANGDGKVLPTEAITETQTILASDPAHPNHFTFDRIHKWVEGTGNWSTEESLNVTASLYRKQTTDSLVRRVDQVVGGVGSNGEHNVFAVYSPFGDKGPHFHTCVAGKLAALEPAQQNLEAAETFLKNQAIQQSLEKSQEQNHQQNHNARTIGGP